MSKRKRFAKCGHLGLGKFCHRCQLADKLEKEAKGDLKAVAAKVASLRALPGAVVAPVPEVKVPEKIEVSKVEAEEPKKPALTKAELALKFKPLSEIGHADSNR